MSKTISETERRRARQIAYNEAHGIIPRTVTKSREEILQRFIEKLGKEALAEVRFS
jgi:excinuclease ABC subunit B